MRRQRPREQERRPTASEGHRSCTTHHIEREATLTDLFFAHIPTAAAAAEASSVTSPLTSSS